MQDAIDKYAFSPTTKTKIKVVQGTFGDEDEIITKVKTAKPGTTRSSIPPASTTTSNM